jgi:mannosyltransferase
VQRPWPPPSAGASSATASTAAPPGPRSGQTGGRARLAALARAAAPGGAVRRVAGSVWLLPMAVMAAVGAYGIGGPIMWRDELATWSAATRSVPQLWTMLHHIDAVYGVYYLGLHFWIAVFGDSPAAMRVPSLLAMTGAAGLAALIGRRLGGFTAGLTGGLVFALIPGISRFAQEARPYAGATFFAALATLLLLRALERPTWQRWAPYALAVAAAGASNLLALCLLAGHGVGTVLYLWRPAGGAKRGWADIAAGFGLAAVAAVVLDSPLLVEGHKQAAEQIDGLLRPPLSQLTAGVWPEVFCSTAAAVAVIALAAASLAGPGRRGGGFCLASAFVPVVIIWGASQGPLSYWFARYLLFTVPALAAAAGLGIAWLCGLLARQPLRAAAAAAVLVVVAALGLPGQQEIRQAEAHNWWSYPDPVGDIQVDYQGAANVIAAGQRPGDGIVFQVSDHNRWGANFGIEYYLRLRGRPVPTDVFLVRTPAQAGSYQPVECARPAACLRGEPRIWVVYANHLVPGGRYRDPYAAIRPGQAAALRAEHYTIQRMYFEAGITVALLVRR